jgi:hypothetical protein
MPEVLLLSGSMVGMRDLKNLQSEHLSPLTATSVIAKQHQSSPEWLF